ncbi:MAG: anthranilate phosphoribosyltransferase [Candidatus Micrarchaeota archaeon]|nr:anthranilate phosphoribosyltransferase [Candidatus Micrarchaeota archaeon]
MTFTNILDKLIDGKHLDEQEASVALEEVVSGTVNSAQIAAFLTALKIKGASIDEIVGFVKIMRKNVIVVDTNISNLVDTAGTGGDSNSTFNISTCAAFVAAGAGANVAKHGNRAASSKSGSADVLEELGVSINADEKTAAKQLKEIGITFLFAPTFHPAMKAVAQVRKELGFKTIFNLLGPLTNPANAKRQLIGVSDKGFIKIISEAMEKLGTTRTLLVSSDIDELSISDETEVYEINNNEIKKYIVSPEDFGLKRTSLSSIVVEGKEKSAEIILEVLKGVEGPARDIVILNAGAAIYAAGIANNIEQGIRLAEKSINSGKAMEKLELLKNYKFE